MEKFSLFELQDFYGLARINIRYLPEKDEIHVEFSLKSNFSSASSAKKFLIIFWFDN